MHEQSSGARHLRSSTHLKAGRHSVSNLIPTAVYVSCCAAVRYGVWDSRATARLRMAASDFHPTSIAGTPTATPAISSDLIAQVTNLFLMVATRALA